MVRWVLLSLLLLSPQSAFAKPVLVQLKATNPSFLSRALEEHGFDVAGVSVRKQEVGVVTEFPHDLKLLQAAWRDHSDLGFTILSETPSEPYLDYFARTRSRADKAYFGAEESLKALRELEKKYPRTAKVFDLNALLGAEKTLEGRSIYALQVSGNPSRIEDEPKILIIGQHHARELTTQHAVIDSAADYLETTDSHSISRSAVWFVPVLNPDGLTYVLKHNRMWRKNRAKNPDGTRGVDLNRNYDFKWGACGLNSLEGNSEVYRGPEPMSEPELRLMDKLNALLRFQYSISYHSYGNEVLNPYLCGTLAETSEYFRLRDLLANTLQFGKRPPSSSGEDHEYHYNKYGTLSFLLEVGEEFQPAFSVYESEVWPKVRQVLPIILEEALSKHTKISVVDDDTGAPLSADLILNEIAFKEGEVRQTDAFGAYRWMLPKASYTLHAHKDGYSETTLSFSTSGDVDSVTLRLRNNRRLFSWNRLSTIANLFF